MAGKAGLMVMSRAVTITVQMLSLMALTRILTKEDFGLLTFVLLAYATVTTLSQVGLPDSIFYYFERVPPESRKTLAYLTSKTLLKIGLGTSILFVVLTFVAPLWGHPVDGLFIPLIFLALLELPTIPVPNVLIAIDRAKDAAWFNIVASVLQLATLIVPALMGQPLLIILLSYLGYGVVRFLLSVYLFFKNFKGQSGELPAGMAREQLLYSLPLGLAQMLWGLNRQIDKYIIAAFFPIAIFAEYSIGAWEIPLIPSIAYAVASVMMPQFVANHIKNDREGLLSLWFTSIQKVSIIVLPLTILFLISAEEFIAVCFSEKYLAAAVPFRIYTLILLQRVAAYSSMHRALGNTKVISYAAAYLLLINVGLSLPLVILMGVAGPPTATLLANIFTWVYTLQKMRRTLAVSFKEVFPFRFYGKTLLTAVMAGIPVFILKMNVNYSYAVDLIWMATLYLTLYALLSKVAGVVKKEDWQFLARGLKLKAQ